MALNDAQRAALERFATRRGLNFDPDEFWRPAGEPAGTACGWAGPVYLVLDRDGLIVRADQVRAGRDPRRAVD